MQNDRIAEFVLSRKIHFDRIRTGAPKLGFICRFHLKVYLIVALVGLEPTRTEAGDFKSPVYYHFTKGPK